jgi:hypothetical protein
VQNLNNKLLIMSYLKILCQFTLIILIYHGLSLNPASIIQENSEIFLQEVCLQLARWHRRQWLQTTTAAVDCRSTAYQLSKID